VPTPRGSRTAEQVMNEAIREKRKADKKIALEKVEKHTNKHLKN
jgi:hypothetical protein